MSKILIVISKCKGFFIGFISSVFLDIVFVSAQSDINQMQDMYGTFTVDQQTTLWTLFKEMWLPASITFILFVGLVFYIIKDLRRRAIKKTDNNISNKL